MGTWKSLRDRVNTVLTTLTGSGQPLYAVYNAHNYVPAGFPYATIGPSEEPSNFDTNAEHLRTYGIDIYVWCNVESTDVGEAAALDTVMDATDLIINALDQDTTLNGLATGGCRPTSTQIKVFDTANGTMIAAKITVKADVIYQFRSS